MSYNLVSIDSVATQILPPNTARLSLIIVNGGSDKVHFAEDANVTTANAPYLIPNGTFTEDSGGTKVYCGPFYGISTGGAGMIYYWERTR